MRPQSHPQANRKPTASQPQANRKPTASQAVGNRNGILKLRYRCGCPPVGYWVAWGWPAGGFWQAWGKPGRQPEGGAAGDCLDDAAQWRAAGFSARWATPSMRAL
jgi:hypothetical protein